MILSQKSFARGILGPRLHGRPDLVDYAFGAKELLNLQITKEAVAKLRGGFRFVDQLRYPDKKVKRIRFVFSASTGDTYVVEIGEGYIEFIRAGERILEASVAISGASQAATCVITTSAPHSFSAGDDVRLSGFTGGMRELNGRRVRVASPGASTFEITDTSGTPIDSTGFSAYSSGGAAARVYAIDCPYVEADLPKIKYSQAGDVMTLVHPEHAPQDLVRAGHTDWTLEPSVLDPVFTEEVRNTGFFFPAFGTAGGAGALKFRYRVCPIDAETGEEGPPMKEGVRTVAGITKANPAVVTTSLAHGYEDGDEVVMLVDGMDEVDSRVFIINVLSSTTFQLLGEDSTGYGTMSTGFVQRTFVGIYAAAAPTPAAPHTITIFTIPTVPFTGQRATRFSVYKELGGLYGFVGYADVPKLSRQSQVDFLDVGLDPDTSDNPIDLREYFTDGRFDEAGEYPAAVAHNQQRRVFGGALNTPQLLELSAIDYYGRFAVPPFLTDEDAFNVPLDSREVNQIRHLISSRRLVVLTGAEEFVIDGGEAGALVPGGANAKVYTNQGASDVRPEVVDGDILFVQARGNTIRNLFWDFGNDTYAGEDLTRKVGNLFQGYTILAMAFSRKPDDVLWVVRSDGVLLSLTYSRAEQIFAWCEHETDGLVEDVVSIPENDAATVGGEDAVYIGVVRTVNGQTLRYTERLTERYISEAARLRFPGAGTKRWEEPTHLDSFGTYDGRNVGAGTLTLSGSGFTPADTLTLTASDAGTFLPTDVGLAATSRRFFLWTPAGELVRLRVTQYTSGTVVQVKADTAVPAALQGVATTAWAIAVRRVTGLSHLEGCRISAVADGFRVANASIDQSPISVEDGAVTLGQSAFAAVIHVGLPFIGAFEALDVESSEGPSVYGKKKAVKNVGAYVLESRAFHAGIEIPTGANPVANLSAWQSGARPGSSVPDAEAQPTPYTGHVDVPVRGLLSDHGRASIVLVEPYPFTMISFTRSVEVKG